jgi:diadenosine tetraphosphate (Ap4A) HIT family hydrolase
MTPCPLCESYGGRLVLNRPAFRVVHVDEPGLPAYYRLIWNDHVAELTDLPMPMRTECLQAVMAMEELLRDFLAPLKINLASLGNQVPHLHWHVIARFDWDSHYPDAVWAAPRRAVAQAQIQTLREKLPSFERALVKRFSSQTTQNMAAS